MNKISRIIQGTSTSCKQKIVHDALKEQLDEVTSRNGLDPVLDLQAEKPITNDELLRDRVIAIQRIKKDLGIENQAAIDFTGGVAAGIAVALVVKGAKELVKYIWKKGYEANIAQRTTKAIESLGEYWDKGLDAISEKERVDAIKELTAGDLKKANSVVDNVWDGIEAQFSNTQNFSDEDFLLVNKQIVRGFFAALEALYQRSDVEIKPQVACSRIVSLLAKPHLVIDTGSKEHMRRILVRNWKVPIEGYKIPSPKERLTDYRLGIYNTILSTLVQPDNKPTPDDPLFLRPLIHLVPKDMQTQASELRKSLLKALNDEIAVRYTDAGNHDRNIVMKIQEILTHSGVPKDAWEDAAKEQKKIDDNNKLIFSQQFKGWAPSVCQIVGSELQTCFNYLVDHDQELVDNLKKIGELLSKRDFLSEAVLNEELSEVLDLMKLDSNETRHKLTQKNSEKGLFFFRYLNALVERKVVVDNNPEGIFKNYLSDQNKDRLLKACRMVVHDRVNFSEAAAKSYEFFVNPPLASVTGQALALHHRLTPCFNNEEGYVDAHSLKELVITNAARNLSPPGEKGVTLTSGFLLSGPPGTGKTFFAEALANQLAVPLFRLDPDIVTITGKNMTVSFDGKEMSLGNFFAIVKTNSPCVLLLDDVDELLPPRDVDKSNKSDDGDEEGKESEGEEDNLTQTGKFLPAIQNIRDKDERGASRVILILTTNQPPSAKINTDKLNEKGYSKEGYRALREYVSRAAIRRKRVDHKVFTFHKLFNEKQGEAFAKRFIGPYVEAGKIAGPVDYVKAGKAIMKYAPAIVESTFDDFVNSSSGQVTQEQLLAELESQPSMLEGRADYKIVKSIESRVTILLEEEKKKLEVDLDYDELAIAAKGLSHKQIKIAIEDHTPEVLTQENILAAFEKIRSEKV